MNRALVDPGLAEKQRFMHMSNTDKLGVAIRHAALRLPAEARDQAMALVDPANLAIMAGALAVWVGAQATPVGWVVNIAMIGVGVAATGAVAVQVARELRDFALGVLGADDTADLRAAGDHLAKAVVLVGVDLVVALLLKKAIVKVREPKMPKLEGGETKLLFGKYDPRSAQRNLPPEPKPSTTAALGTSPDVVKNAAGKVIAKDGTEITGFTKHGVDRAIGDGGKRAGTKPDAILDALKNPKKIKEGVDNQGRPFKIYQGQNARAVINPETGKIISTNPLSGAGAH